MKRKKKQKKIKQKKKKKPGRAAERAGAENEKKIIERVKGGDTRSFGEIVNKYKGVVLTTRAAF